MFRWSRTRNFVQRNIFARNSRSIAAARCYSSSNSVEKKLPTQAEIVIAGGGVIGTSVAYHLANLGWKDIVLLEQGSAGCGTSWHAAGLVGAARATMVETINCLYAIELFSKFEKEYGVGFKQCGSLLLAQTEDRALLLKKQLVRNRQFGIESELMTPEEALKVNPFIRTDDLKLAFHIPNDGVVNPTDLVSVYLKEATKNGATNYLEGVQVKKINSDKNRVTSVETSEGKVNCDIFINCGGMWAQEMGWKSTPYVNVPLHSCEHFYIVTKPIENLGMIPVTRDYDSRTYVREFSGGLMCGGFEPDGRACFYDGVPGKFEFQLLQEDWDHFGYLMDGFLNRYPVIHEAEIRSFINGPESFTPTDSKPHIGRSTEFKNYYMAAGMSSFGIAMSASVGKNLSEIVTFGDSDNDSSMYDIRRLPKACHNKLYAHDAAAWSLKSHYELIYPKSNLEGCRNVMNSPLHYHLDNYGAVWNNMGNWEVPIYFNAENAEHSPTFGKPDWLPNVQAELKACEENVGITDYSSLSKLSIRGSDSEALHQLLASLCLCDVNEMQSGDVAETVLLSKQNGCQSTISLVKVNDNKFMVITTPEQHQRAASRLQDVVDEHELNVEIEDISGKYAVLSFLGPHAEELLSDLLNPPYGTKDIMNGTCKPVDIGYASNVKLRKHFSNGMNEWLLYIPSEFSQTLYKQFMEVGEKYGIRNVGLFARDSVRIENSIPKFSSELHERTDIHLLKDLYQGNNEVKSKTSLKLLEVTLPASENWPWGTEPLLYDGKIIGNLSSVGYQTTSDKVLALVLTSHENLDADAHLQIHCGEDLYDATILNTREGEDTYSGERMQQL